MTRASDERLSGAARYESLCILIGCLLASLGIVWTVWSVPFVVTNDGPQSLLLAHIDAHYDDPGSIFPTQFTRGLGLSGRGFMFLYAPLEGLAWPNGVRVAQAVMLLAFAWGGTALTRALDGRLSYKSLLGFVLCASWPFYMGFWAYCVASAVGLWILAAMVAQPQPTRLAKLGISVGLLVELLCHPVMGTITYVAVALIAVSRHLPIKHAKRQALIADAVWLLLSAVPNVVVFGIMQGAQADMSKVLASETSDWATLPTLLASLPRLVVPGSTALGWLVLGVGAASLVRALARLRREPSSARRGLTIAGFGLLSLAVLGPLNMPGWQYFAPRFLAVALTFCLALLPEIAVFRGRAAALFAASISLLLAVLNGGSLNAKLASACGDALVALNEPRARTGVVMPIIFDARCGFPTDPGLAPIPYSAPALHMSAMFPIRHGGTTPFVFSGPAAVHVLVPRATDLVAPPLELWGFNAEAPEMVDPEKRAYILDRMLLFGMTYEAVQVFGKTDADREQVIARGMVVEADHGSYLSGRMEPCLAEVVVEVEPTDPPIRITAGLRSLELWKPEWVSPPPTARARFAAVCGKLWAKISWEDGRKRCKNADEEGRIRFVAPADERSVVVSCER